MVRNKRKGHIGTYEGTGDKNSEMELSMKLIGRNLGFAASEAYKLLRTNLMFSMSDEKECKIVGVSSALRGEGKSTTSLNLAYSLAENGKRTLFVEANMRIPIVAAVLNIESSPGLSHILTGLSNPIHAVRGTDLSTNLFVLPAGDIPPNPSELLSSERMQLVVEALAKAFDYIIMDLPPINTVSDGLAVSKLLSGMIIVVRRDYCDHHSLAEAMRQLEFLKVRLLGFVLNGADSHNKRGGNKRKKHCRTEYDYGQHRKQESTSGVSPADLAESPDSAYETVPGKR